jgi:signal peptidase II
VTSAAATRRGLVIGGVAATVVALDQVTKTLAIDHLKVGVPRHLFWTLQLNLTFNTGIAFSQATGKSTLVTIVGLAVLTALVVIAGRTRGTGTAIALGLIIGGAVGNLADRIVRHHTGGVIDFIDPRWWPVFNVADAAVTVGAVLAAVLSLFPREP